MVSMRLPYREPASEHAVPAGLTECPHCLTEVLAERDGSCPSCRQDVTRLPEGGLRRAKLRIDGHIHLPFDMCCTCGGASETVESVGGSDEPAHPLLARALFTGLILLSCGWFLLLIRRIGSSARRIELAVPRCSSCKSEPLVPAHANLAEGSVTLVVAREFAERVTALNRCRAEAALLRQPPARRAAMRANGGAASPAPEARRWPAGTSASR
jgi:hypothetical protein